MKLFLVSLIVLAIASTSVMALPEPAPAAAEPTTYTDPVAARAKTTISGTVTADSVKYLTCPHIGCTSKGQYKKGAHVDILCYTVDGTTVTGGDAGWAKLTNKYWVPLGWGDIVSWSDYIPDCKYVGQMQNLPEML